MKFLFKRRKPPAPVFDAPFRPADRCIVIGDVHGCDALLAKLLGRLEGRSSPETKLVLVGDYVDRGDESAAVLRRLQQMQARLGTEQVICLRGNHDQMMLDFLDDPKTAGARWFKYGGLQTLASYGLAGVAHTAPDEEWIKLRDRLRAAMGPEIETWLRGLPLSWQTGNVFICHAGADPLRPLEAQSSRDLIWGPPGFETTARTDGVWVVHGHTITDHARPNAGRVPVDTGAYATGRLTAALLSSGKVEFVST
ncbi:serine/threonine protein phosphatase [Yangia mangrovi]|uniref:Serine/threonine protein phosphatase n=1 Tax=Alloyangia mangrovi TaxID=1779329 RepID=A0A2A3JTP0_9RHOB|nr:metallophosphoesterase family protein [Alloyangia mangrovi]MCA0942237.1 serine/threonine protein phosphatase [Alloyangia pacifica]MCA0947488.1 serine/threonine protein phosphatase [Alloyangia pacifica]MCT4369434.1 serine/threonine protein phosphatase [Alloyangia mangrovi]